MQRHGDTRLAALLSALAAESLLDELLMHLKWEEAATPERAADSWINGLVTRIKREYPSRLGGNWDFGGEGPIGRWNLHVAELRHRIVHGGYVPTEEEASRAYASINALVEFLVDRLATDQCLRKYPRTALTLAGETGLTRRGRYTQWLRELQKNEDEPPWRETFRRWRDTHSRLRRDVATEERWRSATPSHLVAVLHSAGDLRWVVHDYGRHLAAEVAFDERLLGDGHRQSLAKFVSEFSASARDYPASLAILDFDLSRLTPTALWREEYHHIPMAEVMVDKSDFRRH